MTPLELLWSGWRATYVQSAGKPDDDGDERSVFTRILEADSSDEDKHILHRGERVFAILNAYPYAVGHLLVLPYREAADLTDLTEHEARELWGTVRCAVVALRGALQPTGVNVGLNLGQPAGGSVSQHLHVHVVPRWIGDANFMTATANTRTLPEALPDTAAKLRAAWPR